MNKKRVLPTPPTWRDRLTRAMDPDKFAELSVVRQSKRRYFNIVDGHHRILRKQGGHNEYQNGQGEL